MDTKIDKRGGHRPNSGRPKSVSKRIQVCLYLRPEVADKLKQMAKVRGISMGRLIEGWFCDWVIIPKGLMKEED